MIIIFVVGSIIISYSSILHDNDIIYNDNNNAGGAVIITTIINDEPTTTTSTTTDYLYKRFDEMGPKELYGVTLEWKSLPETMKYPATTISKDEFTKQKLWQQQKQQREQHYYYSEINPSIIKINDPNILPMKFQKQKLKNDNDDGHPTRKIEYIVSSRITNINNCHKRVFKKQFNDGNKHNLLGLAFLDTNLQMISDVVIDLQPYFPLFKFEDYRLFYDHHQQQLYVSSFQWAYPIWFNIPSTTTDIGIIDPASIIHLTSSINNSNDNNNTTNKSSLPPRDSSSFDVYTLQNHHVCLGYDIMKNLNPFEVSISTDTTSSTNTTTTTTTTTTTKTLLELYPMGEIVDITKRFIIKKQNHNIGGIMNNMTATTTTINKANCRGGRGGRGMSGKNGGGGGRGGDGSIKQQQRQRQRQAVKPSFQTVEELYFQRHKLKPTKVLSGPRGGSCCVGPIQMPNSTITNVVSSSGSSTTSSTFLLGILHYQLYWKSTNYPGNVVPKQYYSAFYALDPRNGTTIALSGKFCLPAGGHHHHHHDTTTDSSSSAFSNNTNTNNLLLSTWNNQSLHLDMNQVFNCPKIHFVSGMALTTTSSNNDDDDHNNDDDDNDNHNHNQQQRQQLILGYGVNDCTSRLIKVNLQDVINILWPTTSSSSSFG